MDGTGLQLVLEGGQGARRRGGALARAHDCLQVLGVPAEASAFLLFDSCFLLFALGFDPSEADRIYLKASTEEIERDLSMDRMASDGPK